MMGWLYINKLNRDLMPKQTPTSRSSPDGTEGLLGGRARQRVHAGRRTQKHTERERERENWTVAVHSITVCVCRHTYVCSMQWCSRTQYYNTYHPPQMPSAAWPTRRQTPHGHMRSRVSCCSVGGAGRQPCWLFSVRPAAGTAVMPSWHAYCATAMAAAGSPEDDQVPQAAAAPTPIDTPNQTQDQRPRPHPKPEAPGAVPRCCYVDPHQDQT